jgi:hypothetical protein
MAKIVYKVAPRCGGKTVWLCERAKEELEAGKVLFYYTNAERMRHFNSFKEKYEYFCNGVCAIEPVLKAEDIPAEQLSNAAVLVDNFMEYMDGSQFVHGIKNNDQVTIYITLNDDCVPAQDKITELSDAKNWEQLSLF